MSSVGLLFCYDDPPITGRDGKRGLKSLITRGKNYRDMLYTLINDISIELSNWYQCVVKVPAWAAFMERCFLADIEVIRIKCWTFVREIKEIIIIIIIILQFNFIAITIIFCPDVLHSKSGVS